MNEIYRGIVIERTINGYEWHSGDGDASVGWPEVSGKANTVAECEAQIDVFLED